MLKLMLYTYPIQHSFLKRSFDIFFSLAILCIFSPVFLILSIGIKCSSPGPIFYTHIRTTRGGKKFKCLKFRTMYVNADKLLQKILSENQKLKKEWLIFYKLKKDPRVTPFGKFLRKTSLDELPQFINVLKGDLSVVGPRPVIEEELIQYFGEKAKKILSIRPGVTGLWQVSGRNGITMQERVLIEESYVESHNFLKDLIIILKTIPAIFFSKGAY